jgi:uncharacterized membrane protein
MRSPVLLAIAALALAACGGTPDQAPAERFTGHLVWGHEARSFTGCGTTREAWVVDRTEGDLVEVYEGLAVEAYQPVFVEIRGRREPGPSEGFGAEYPEQVVVTELRRAEREGWGCRLDLTGVEFVALGNEPSWRLEIRESGIVLTRPGHPEARHARSAPRRDGAVTIYETGDLVLVLNEQRCVDTMAGSRFSYSAQLKLGDRTLEGCALAGTTGDSG